MVWAANHGIHDLAGSPNNFAGGNWTYDLDPDAPLPGVVISEFMADNKNTIHDEDGDSPDWIEIFNPTANDMNLAGWALTDDPKNLVEWQFPNVTLAANSYLLVFASGKDRTNVIGRLHTNFQLASSGEFLALVDRQTNIMSSFTPVYPPQEKDVSYGRDRFSQDVVGYFTTPTPGAPNSTVGTGFSTKVQFAAEGGTFTTAFALGLWTASTNAAIRFTLDGSAPTETSTLYTGPINITNSVQVRARSWEAGLLPGPLHSESYVLLNPNVINLTTDLPVIVIHTGQRAKICNHVLLRTAERQDFADQRAQVKHTRRPASARFQHGGPGETELGGGVLGRFERRQEPFAARPARGVGLGPVCAEQFRAGAHSQSVHFRSQQSNRSLRPAHALGGGLH